MRGNNFRSGMQKTAPAKRRAKAVQKASLLARIAKLEAAGSLLLRHSAVRKGNDAIAIKRPELELRVLKKAHIKSDIKKINRDLLRLKTALKNLNRK